MSTDDDTYSVQARWKEEVVYREGDRSIVFDAGWGSEPRVLYVPSEWAWDLSTPAWLHGRRAEVVARLERDSRHVIAVDDVLDARLRERAGAAVPTSVRVEVMRLDAHPGDLWGLEMQVDVASTLMLSEMLATVLEPFLGRAPEAAWRCRSRVEKQWRDLAEVVTTGAAERRGARLLAQDVPLHLFMGAGQAVLRVACRPT